MKKHPEKREKILSDVSDMLSKPVNSDDRILQIVCANLHLEQKIYKVALSSLGYDDDLDQYDMI